MEYLEKQYSGITEAMYAVAGQGVHAEATDYIPAKMVIAAGTVDVKVAKKKVVTVTEIASLTGLVKYPRPNGENYFARLWGGHSDVEAVRKGREKNHFILLYGAPGCGKTALVEAAFGEELETIIGTGDTEVGDFIGGYVQTPSGGFDWVDGPLVRAAEQGKVLLIDEIGLIDPKVLSLVYGLMDGRDELVVTANPERGTVKAKDGFYVIAATNPNAPGVNLSEALLSRFSIQAEMSTDYSLAKKLGAPQLIVTAAMNLAKKQASQEVSWAPQMRELLKFKQISEDFGTTWAISNLLACAPFEDRPVVADVLTRVFGEEFKPAKI